MYFKFFTSPYLSARQNSKPLVWVFSLFTEYPFCSHSPEPIVDPKVNSLYCNAHRLVTPCLGISAIFTQNAFYLLCLSDKIFTKPSQLSFCVVSKPYPSEFICSIVYSISSHCNMLVLLKSESSSRLCFI